MEAITQLGVAPKSIKTIADIANSVKSAETRIELNSKIAGLESQLLSARQQMVEMQDDYERVLKENRDLKDEIQRQSDVRSSVRPKLK